MRRGLSFRSSAVAVLAVGGLLLAGQPARLAASPARTGEYIVRLKPSANLTTFLVSEVKRGVNPKEIFTAVFPGFQARLTSTSYQRLSRDKRVSAISKVSTFSIPRKPIVRNIGYVWGLDRVDQQRLPLNNLYSPLTSGRGVAAFVIDTGVDASHPEFGGRVRSGFSAIGSGNGTTDCHGHGTHVAGTIGGNNVGVANETTIVPIRVLDCDGRGTTGQILRGIDAAIQLRQRGEPAVANLSLGGTADPALDAGVRAMVSAGITVVVAAGNSNKDACLVSPAREASVLTVGATSQSDTRAFFSNFGRCLDLFAPGVEILSGMPGQRYAQLNGTSMAAPHAAGVAALVLQSNPTLSPAAVSNLLINNSTSGQVADPRPNSPNRLLFSNIVVQAPTPPTTTVPPTTPGTPTTTVPPTTTTTTAPLTAPGPVTSLRGVVTDTSVVALWSEPGTGGRVADYVVEYRKSTDSGWTLHQDGVSTSTSTIVGPLSAGTYVVRVAAKNAAGQSQFIESSAVTIASQSSDVTLASSSFKNPWTRAVVSELQLDSGGGQVSLEVALQARGGLPSASDQVWGQLCPASVRYPNNNFCTGSLFPGESARGTSGTYGGLFILSSTAAAGAWYATIEVRTSDGVVTKVTIPAIVTVKSKPVELPGAPTNLAISASGNDANVSWSAPTNNGGGSISDYVVDYWAKGGTSWTRFADGVSAVERAVVRSLPTNIYSFRVAAVNEAGIGAFVQSGDVSVGAATTSIVSDRYYNTAGATISSIKKLASGLTWVWYEVRLTDSLGRLPSSFGGQLCPSTSTYPFGSYCTGATFGRNGTSSDATYVGLFGISSAAPTGSWKVTYDPVGRIESPRRLNVT